MLPVQQFQDFIRQQQLFKKGNRILLTVSGGKDSVLMLHLFKAAGIDIGVAHVNFNLRAEEAQRDENFVKTLCQSLNLPFYVTHFETKKYAAEHKISTQMAARELRYSWFEKIRSAEGYDFIALAQHQNDAVETLLINLVRGTGISGLHGILPKRGRLIRPMLFLSRQQIDHFIEANNISFVEDSSNLSIHYTRNRLRLEVVPHLQKINPNLENTFAQNISRFTEIEELITLHVSEIADRIIAKKGDDVYISIKEIAELKPQKLLLFELLKPFGFTDKLSNEILSSLASQSGKSFFSHTHRAIINRGDLIITKIESSANEHQTIHPSTGKFQFNRYKFQLSFSNDLGFEAVKHKIFTDADQLLFPLILRTRKNGDKFIPLGMRHFKKISDFFIDEKVPLHMKDNIPILINGNGNVIWIAGMRQDNRYKLSEATKKVAIFELKIN